MFDDLINKIKSKLPEKFRGEDDEFDEDEKTSDIDVQEIMDGDDVDSEVDDDDEDEDDDDEELDEDEEKKQKRSKIIKIVVGVAVLALAADMLLEEEKPAPAPMVKKRKRPKRKNRNKKSKNKIAKQDEKMAAPVAKKQDPSEVVKPIQKTTPVPTVAAIPEPVIEATPEPVVEVTPEPIVENTPEPIMPTLGEEIKTNVEPVQEQKNKVTLEDMASKIEAPKVEYIEPPNYEQFGRGLVYNCKGKHWACVDRKAYLDCSQNQKWSDENKKKYECKTSNIYATDKDCRVMQVHNINTIKDTKFCNQE